MFRVGSGEVWRKGSMRVRGRGLCVYDLGGHAGALWARLEMADLVCRTRCVSDADVRPGHACS